MIASLILRLKEDLGLHLSDAKACSSFPKCHIRWSSLLYSSKSLFNFDRSISLAESTIFKPLDNKEFQVEFLSSNHNPLSNDVFISWWSLTCVPDSERFPVLSSKLLLFSASVRTSVKLISSWQVWEEVLYLSLWHWWKVAKSFCAIYIYILRYIYKVICKIF